jgi:hypothetical protein
MKVMKDSNALLETGIVNNSLGRRCDGCGGGLVFAVPS